MVKKITKTCPHCKTSLIQLQMTHRVGCSQCYISFKEEIVGIKGEGTLLSEKERRERDYTLLELQIKLDTALNHEEYEVAAQIRDKMSGLK